MEEQKVATEVAEQEFARFLEAMDLDVDPKGWDDEDKKAFEECRGRILRAMERGVLVVDEDGQPVLTTTPDKKTGDFKSITFYEPTGKTRAAADQKKSGHGNARTFAMLAHMTRETVTLFENMKQRDFKVCESVFLLFFGSR